MGKSLLFLVSGLTILTGIVQVRNSERISEIPSVTTDYFKTQQARNLSRSLIDNAVETMEDNMDWTGSISLSDVVDTLSLLSRDYDARKLLALGGTGTTLDLVHTIEEQKLTSLINSNSILGTSIKGSLESFTSASQNIPQDNSVGVWDEYKLLLVSSTQYDDIEVTTEVLMQRDSYSKYSYMTQSELSVNNTRIWFMDVDNIYGPIHTNGEFAMAGEPSFYGMVTSPNDWVKYEDLYSSTIVSDPNFYGGENFRAPVKSPPTTYELDKLRATAAEGGITFDGDIKLDFYVSGDIGYADISKEIVTSYTCGSRRRPRICYTTTWETETLDLDEINGVISSTGKIEVEGTVKGQITVHSEDEIEIMGDIYYNTNPMDDSTSTDMLGIVSEGDVIVDQYAYQANGSSDLTIHASIMALNTSFEVENYSSGSPRGTLNLLGGIVQKNRGAVGTFYSSTGSVASGYAKNYMYDNRLKGSIPPSFPRESVFSIVYWKEDISKISD